MDKELARKLLPLVNDQNAHDELLAYADHRIEVLKEQLTNAQDFESVLQLQGSIREMKQLKYIRQIVHAKLEEK